LLHIFSFLDGKDILKGVELTCTAWNHLGNETSLWEHIVHVVIDRTVDPLPLPKAPPASNLSSFVTDTVCIMHCYLCSLFAL